MKAYEKEVDEDEFEEMLNELYDDISVMGMTYGQGTALKELDPTAFRCMMADEPITWICGECDAEFEDEDEADECCVEEDDDE